jgi:hypothetical protein
MGALLMSMDDDAAARFPMVGLGGPWNHRPPPDSEADIEQAVAGKIHISHRLLPLLAGAQLIVIEPERVASVPRFSDGEEEAVYSSEAKLPASPVFLDFEGVDGSPVVWEAETWPLPFYLRGALCWQQEELLSIIPFGSVGSRHPWGGTDYQAWSRWIYLQGHSAEWPELGPGDFMSRANGEVRSWVDAESGSICAHLGSVSYNLCRGVLSVLMALEALDVEFVPECASRQVRRRAERKGERIGLVPRVWPISIPSHDEEPTTAPAEVSDEHPGYAPEEECPIPKTHARLTQCHLMWHEALEAYADPDAFVGHLNALIQGLRTVTLVLQKELRHCDGFNAWYEEKQEAMRADARMKWLVSARNEIEKEGDLDASSVAHVRVIAGWLRGPVTEMEVEPTTEAHEIARKLQVAGLPARAMREGILEVERRWTLRELAGDEILDVLAHCYGVLTRIIVAAHEQWGGDFELCALGGGEMCKGASRKPHPSGRVPCMIASRSSRTVCRDLESGALVDMGIQLMDRPEIAPEDLLTRYGPDFPIDEPPEGEGAFGAAELFHKAGRQFILTDENLVTVVWLFKGGQPLKQIALEPEDQREKYLSIERVAEEVDRLGADEIVFTAETWEASAVPYGDRRAGLRPAEREDRTEAIVTYALRAGGECRVWHSPVERTANGTQLGDITTHEDAPLFLAPILKVWETWGNNP